MSNINSKSLKVLMFGWEFPPHISGGLGTACFGLTKSMIAHGTSILFVIPRASGEQQHPNCVSLLGCNEISSLTNEELIRQLPLDGEWMNVIAVDTLLRPYHNEEQYTQLLLARGKGNAVCRDDVLDDDSVININQQYGDNLIAEVVRYSKSGTRLGVRGGFDVIHAHDWMCYLAGVEAKRQSGKPLVCHVHATEYDRSGVSPDPNIYNIERYGLQQADLVITVSNRTRDTVHQYYDIPLDKIRVVYNGVVKDKLIKSGSASHAYKDKIVLFLGRVTMQKGPEYFIRAAAIVLKKIPHVRFVMAGNGDKLPAMIDLIAQLRLQDRFHFTGFLSSDKAEKMYELSDVFVMPSVSEPFGITPIEAMKYDVPTIISRQSGVAEILINTIKVDFWDVDELARAIIDVLTDGHTSDELIQGGRNEVGEITWDKAALKVLSCYDELVMS